MWIPADCSDGVAAAYWRRPEAYTDPAVQRSISLLALLPDHAVARGTAALVSDLADGTWHARMVPLGRLPTPCLEPMDPGSRTVAIGQF